jgi:hypothetical protein
MDKIQNATKKNIFGGVLVDTDLKNQLIISILSYFLILSITIFNIISRIGFEINLILFVKIVGFSLFFSSLGSINRLFLSRFKHINTNTALVILLLFFLVFLSAYLPSILSNIVGLAIVIIGYLFSIYIVILFAYNTTLKEIFFFSLVFMLFSIWVVGDFYKNDYASPVFIEKLAVGLANKDQLFLISTAQMIKTYGIPSTGLDGLPFLHYHFGSLYFFANISILLSCSASELYNYLYPICFLSLFFNILLQVALQISKYYSKEFSISFSNIQGQTFWTIFFITNIGLFPTEMKRFVVGGGLHFFASESYLFSIILLLLTISFILNFSLENISVWEKVFIFTLTIILLISKISTGFLFIPIIIYLLFRNKQLFNLSNIIIFLIAIPILYFAYNLVTDSVKRPIELFHFIKNYTDTNVWYYFLPIYFAPIFAFVFVSILHKEKQSITLSWSSIKSGNFILEEVLLLLAFISLIPGLILSIGAGDASYFSQVPREIGILFLIGSSPVIASFIERYQAISHKVIFTFLCIPVCLMFLHVTFANAKIAFGKVTYFRYEIINSPISQSYPKIHSQLKTNYRYMFLRKLDSLDKLPLNIKNNLVAVVPSTDSGYYFKWFSNQDEKWQSSFIVPAISGICLIDGLPRVPKKKYPYSHGLSSYQNRNIENIKGLNNRKQTLGLSSKKIIFLETSISSY